ncbi:MAG: flagellar biosynthesis repressor FlbT [Hyphomicrobiales bacterium]|nr:flagellar biosynthesis repressor FlbT [Hyphomicrobiales bacterium]
MSKSLHIAVKAGERIYINGAVMRFNCKVSIEILNDVTFLLESHVMLPEQTTSPLRQLYFAAQTLLIEPNLSAEALRVFLNTHSLLCSSTHNQKLLCDLNDIRDLVTENRVFEALKLIRTLYVADDKRIPAPSPRCLTMPYNLEMT